MRPARFSAHADEHAPSVRQPGPAIRPCSRRNQRLARRVQARVKVAHLGAVVSLAASIAACGTSAGGQPAGPPTVATATAGSATASPARTVAASGPAVSQPGSAPPTLTGPATLTTADNGATVRLRRGQRVTVVLSANGALSWHVPAAADAAVTRVSRSGGYPGRKPARAVFLAVRSGRATLTALDDTVCLHTQPACELPQQTWQVTVIVTGS